jgi:hypothetical protein
MTAVSSSLPAWSRRPLRRDVPVDGEPARIGRNDGQRAAVLRREDFLRSRSSTALDAPDADRAHAACGRHPGGGAARRHGGPLPGC